MDKDDVEVAHIIQDGDTVIASVDGEPDRADRVYDAEEKFSGPAKLSPAGNVCRNLLENYAIEYRWPSTENDDFIEIQLNAAFGTVWMRVEVKAVHTLLITTKE